MTFEEAIKYATGMTVAEVQNMSISDHRIMMEKKFGKPTSFPYYFDCVKSHDSIEKEFQAAIDQD